MRVYILSLTRMGCGPPLQSGTKAHRRGGPTWPPMPFAHIIRHQSHTVGVAHGQPQKNMGWYQAFLKVRIPFI